MKLTGGEAIKADAVVTHDVHAGMADCGCMHKPPPPTI